MERYGYNAYSKYDMKVHPVSRTREILRQVAMKNEVQIISGKIAAHIFISYKPQQSVSKIVQLLKGISSRLLMQDFSSLRKPFWGSHLLAISCQFWYYYRCGDTRIYIDTGR